MDATSRHSLKSVRHLDDIATARGIEGTSGYTTGEKSTLLHQNEAYGMHSPDADIATGNINMSKKGTKTRASAKLTDRRETVIAVTAVLSVSIAGSRLMCVLPRKSESTVVLSM